MLTFQEALSHFLYLELLLRSVWIVLDSAPAGQSVVHLKLLLQFSDLPLVLLQKEGWVLQFIDHCLVLHLHHTSSKLEGRDGLLQVFLLRPDVCDHYRLAVATNRIFQKIGQLALPVRDVILLGIASRNHHLLQEGQRFVDIIGLFEPLNGIQLLGPLVSGKVNQVKLGNNNLLASGLLRFTLNINCVNRVGSAAVLVHLSGSKSLLLLSLEQVVEGLLLIGDLLGDEPLHMHLPFGIILDGEARSTLVPGLVRKQIVELLIVDLKIADGDNDLLLGVGAYFLEDLVDGSRDDSSILEVGSGSIHRKSLSRSCLAVAHDRAIESVDDGLHDFLRAESENVFLRGVMHYLVEFKLPRFLLIVYETT